MKLAVLEQLRAARAAGTPVALATWLDGSDAQVIAPGRGPAELATAVANALRSDRAELAATERGDVLVEPHNPPARLFVIGAVHIAQPLAAMARLVGLAVTIVDPRRAWATPARFPDTPLVLEWPDAALAAAALDARSAVVTLTHDPKLDDPALIAALRSPAFYVGCLGSQRTHAARRDRLTSAGFPPAELARLHGPVGLAIGSRSPAEIAVAILAEIIQTLRGAA